MDEAVTGLRRPPSRRQSAKLHAEEGTNIPWAVVKAYPGWT